MEQYPILRLWVRHGDRIVLASAAVIILAGLWGAAQYGSWVCLVAAAASAGVGYLVRGYAELVRLVTDMLLPK